MKALFENPEQCKAQEVISRDDERAWPTHFHSHIELFIVKSGKYLIGINGKTYDIGDGTLVIFDHYDLHSFEELAPRIDDCVVRIPYDDCAEFDKVRMNKRISNPVIRDAKLVDLVLNIVDSVNVKKDNNYFVAASIKYILALIYKHLEFTDSTIGTENEAEYARRIMLYISDHFREKITTSSIAQEMGYSREHISRIFHNYFRESIQTHVNNKRVEYIEERHRETGRNRTDFILEAGFGCCSSYYRFIKTQENKKIQD